jgi:transposase
MAKLHNEEFRREAVRIALTSGQSRRQVAADLGVGFSTLAKWIQKSRPGDLPPKADIDLAKERHALSAQTHKYCYGYPAISFPSVTPVLPRANLRAAWYEKKTRHLIEITGFYLVAGARFELTTFRL